MPSDEAERDAARNRRAVAMSEIIKRKETEMWSNVERNMSTETVDDFLVIKIGRGLCRRPYVFSVLRVRGFLLLLLFAFAIMQVQR